MNADDEHDDESWGYGEGECAGRSEATTVRLLGFNRASGDE